MDTLPAYAPPPTAATPPSRSIRWSRLTPTVLCVAIAVGALQYAMNPAPERSNNANLGLTAT